MRDCPQPIPPIQSTVLLDADGYPFPLPSGEVLRNLQHRAATLLEDGQLGCFRVEYATGAARQPFLVDTDGHMVQQIERWLHHCATHIGGSIVYKPARWPLIISGVIKVGSASSAHVHVLSFCCRRCSAAS